MQSYIIRVYRGDKKHPQDLVGIVEEVGIKEKKAFANFDELWDILISIKNKSRHSKQNKRLLCNHDEKRSEARMNKQIPCVVICNKQKINAETFNCSENGIGITIPVKIPFAIGEKLNCRIQNSELKAELKWADQKSERSVTFAGLEIVDGKLNIRDVKRMQVIHS